MLDVEFVVGGVCLLSPAMFLTKICIVSSAPADEAREEAEEMELTLPERMMSGLS